MQTYKFTLVLSGVSDLTPQLSDAIYEATGGDVELNLRNGVAFVEFVRTASTLKDAITTAIADVDGTNIGAKVVRVESEAASMKQSPSSNSLSEYVPRNNT